MIFGVQVNVRNDADSGGVFRREIPVHDRRVWNEIVGPPRGPFRTFLSKIYFNAIESRYINANLVMEFTIQPQVLLITPTRVRSGDWNYY